MEMVSKKKIKYCEKNISLQRTTFVKTFQQKMNDLVSHPQEHKQELYTPKDLHDCKYVFIRNDAVKKPYVLLTPDLSR